MEPFTPCDTMTEQRENLLYLLGRMRQMQASADIQRVPQLSISPPTSATGFYKRPAEDQPLDFSAPKNPRLSPDWFPSYSYPDNKHDSLGSDGNSDLSSHSPGSTGESPREPMPGSSSPPRPALTRLSIPAPSPKDSVSSKADLLTTVPAAQLSAPTNKFPLLKPISSLQIPEQIKQEFNPFLNLANLSAAKSSLPNPPVSLSLPFSNLPLFQQTQKPLSFPEKKNSFPSIPLPFQTSSPSLEPLNELTKVSVDSQTKYAEFRENMLKNMETSRTTKMKRSDQENLNPFTPGTPKNKHNDSLDMTPTHHSTPNHAENYDGKDAAYWERRRKNNEAAKRSRDSRRQKENEIAVRASFLEQENIQLKMELVQLRTELGSIRDQMNRRPMESNC